MSRSRPGVGLLAWRYRPKVAWRPSQQRWQVPIATDSSYTKARIESIDDQRVRRSGGRARSS